MPKDYKAPFIRDVEARLRALRGYAEGVGTFDEAKKYVAQLDALVAGNRPVLAREEYERIKHRMTETQILANYKTSRRQIGAYRAWDTMNSKTRGHKR